MHAMIASQGSPQFTICRPPQRHRLSSSGPASRQLYAGRMAKPKDLSAVDVHSEDVGDYNVTEPGWYAVDDAGTRTSRRVPA